LNEAVIAAHDNPIQKGKQADDQQLGKDQTVGLGFLDLSEKGFLVLKDLKHFPEVG
jgi:hypothetical protein